MIPLFLIPIAVIILFVLCHVAVFVLHSAILPIIGRIVFSFLFATVITIFLSGLSAPFADNDGYDGKEHYFPIVIMGFIFFGGFICILGLMMGWWG
jgi:hypothetical protein